MDVTSGPDLGRLTPAQQRFYDSLPEGGVLRRLYEIGAGLDADDPDDGESPARVEKVGARVEFRGRLDRYKEADGSFGGRVGGM